MSISLSADKEVTRFTLAKQLAYLKYNDELAMQLIIMTGMSMYTCSNIPLITSLLFTGVLWQTYSKYAHKRAELFAAKYCEDKKVTGIRYPFFHDSAQKKRVQNKSQISIKVDEHIVIGKFSFDTVSQFFLPKTAYLTKYTAPRKEENTNAASHREPKMGRGNP